jgi:hypothetical protein
MEVALTRRARLRKRCDLILARVRATPAWVGSHLSEIFLVCALLSGWTLLTWGIAGLTTPFVWQISYGILLLSFVGWRFLWTVFRDGLYTLSKDSNSK